MALLGGSLARALFHVMPPPLGSSILATSSDVNSWTNQTTLEEQQQMATPERRSLSRDSRGGGQDGSRSEGSRVCCGRREDKSGAINW